MMTAATPMMTPKHGQQGADLVADDAFPGDSEDLGRAHDAHGQCLPARFSPCAVTGTGLTSSVVSI